MAVVQSNPEPACSNIVTWALSGHYDPHQPVLIDAYDPRRHISKSQAIKLIASLVGAFERDSTVCIHLANDVLYPVLSMAIYASHCRWTGTNIAFTAAELEHHFRISNTNYVITADEHLETVRAAVDCSSTSAEIIIFSDILFERPCKPSRTGCCTTQHEEQFRDLHDLQRNRSPDTLFAAIRDIDINSIATLMPTSGTSGPPKMAARTHIATVLEAAALEENHHSKPYEIRRLYCTPVFHSFSTPEMVINSLRLGFPAYWMKRFDDSIFPQKIQEFGITETFAPPAILLRLSNNSDAARQIQSLRAVYCGGAPLVPELKAKFLKMFLSAPPRIVPVWGMTEGGWFTTLNYPETGKTGSVGYPIDGFEIKVGDEHRTILSNGQEVGELCVRGPHVMSFYHGDAAATARAFDGDWLKTGDVGYINKGEVFVVDRAKDLIKVNGWQVAPVEIEDALLVSQQVQDAGVVGTGTDVDEHPLAFVVLSSLESRSNVTEAILKEELLRRLTRYKVDRCEIRFVDAVPRTISGKILRRELRRMAQAETDRI